MLMHSHFISANFFSSRFDSILNNLIQGHNFDWLDCLTSRPVQPKGDVTLVLYIYMLVGTTTLIK